MVLSGLLIAAALLAAPTPGEVAPPPATTTTPIPVRKPVARRRLAVLPIRPLDVPQARADLLSEVALTEAARFKAVEVMGQSDVAALLGHERQKELLGCKEDSSCMAEIGGAMGAAWLLVGSVGRIGQATRVDLKLIEVAKARVLDRVGETIDAAPDKAIAAVQRGVVALLTPVAGRPQPAPSARAEPGPAEGGEGLQKVIRATVRPGQEVLVRHHSAWGRGCVAGPVPVVRLGTPPARGTVEVRPGDHVAVGAWRSDADPTCLGKVFPGVGIYYRAAAGGPGSDLFRYAITTGTRSPVTYEVEARVTVE
jgi:TolB-like protein